MKEHSMNPVCLSRRDGFGLRQMSQWPLSLERSLVLTLGEGDIVRADGGIVWATVDGELQDIMLNVGDTYLVPRAQRMRFGGYDDARMSVISRAPLLPRASRAALRRLWSRAASICAGLAFGLFDMHPAEQQGRHAEAALESP